MNLSLQVSETDAETLLAEDAVDVQIKIGISAEDHFWNKIKITQSSIRVRNSTVLAIYYVVMLVRVFIKMY